MESSFSEMPVQRTQLMPGITVTTVKTSKFKTTTLTLDFIFPLKKESAALYALLPHVLDRGCALYPTQREICKRLEQLYASSISYRVFKRGDWQVVEIIVDFLGQGYVLDDCNVFKETMRLLYSILREPLLENGSFFTEYVESEKKNLKDLIRSKINNKTRYALNRCIAHMFEGDVYGLPATGSEEDVDAITPDVLTEAYRSFLSQSRIEAFAVGNLSHTDVADAIRNLFDGVVRNYSAISLSSVRKASAEMRSVTENAEMVQGKLVLGFRTGHFSWEESYRAMPLLLEILYGSPTSKLFMKVREEENLCYYCTAVADGLKGVLFIHSGIENTNKDVAFSAIMRQIKDIQEGNISDGEWDFAEKSLKNAYISLYDSPIALCGWYLTRSLAENAVVSPDCFAKRALSVTRQQVMAAANMLTLDIEYFLHGNESAGGEGDDCDEE